MNTTKLYLLRHFERIDSDESDNWDMYRRWSDIDSRNALFSHNPYLSDKAYKPSNINKVLNKIPNISSIDIIVSSPFLRCLQTSLIMMNNINEIKNAHNLEQITKIYVDYGLSEIIDEFEFYDVILPYDLKNIYDNSLTYLTEKQFGTPFEILNSQSKIITEYNNNNTYIQRIKQTVKNIYEHFANKNILIISHSYSSTIINPNKKLDYYEPIIIDPNILYDSAVSNFQNTDKFKFKYLKYKTKYIELKNKIGGSNDNQNQNKNYFDKLKELYPKCITKSNETQKYTETYGEMDYEGIEKINLEFNKNNEIKYFIDIGSGRGKLTCWYAGITNIIKSYGIEIVQQRYDDAIELKKQLAKNFPIISEKIEFKYGDISTINLGQITNNSQKCLIWISNLCFGQELSDKIFKQILEQIGIGTIIACSKKPFENNNATMEINKTNKFFKLLKELEIPMSWTKSSNIFIYQISV